MATILRRIIVGATVAVLASACAAPLFAAATITINNLDAAGEGFNDPTPVAPVGGNTGTTIGQQRLIVFQRAADIWAAILDSAVPIVVDATFDPLPCSTNSGVLGAAGPRTIHANFTGAEFTGFWYHQALANKLRGSDNSAFDDIQATFNSSVGQASCLSGTPWYYGLDHNEIGGIDLLAVVEHELAHGLGFSTTTDPSTGSYNSGLPGLWDRFLFDRTLQLHWNQMTAGQRAASAINTNNLVWDGVAVTATVPQTLAHMPELLVTTPPAIAGTYAVATALFGPPLTTAGVTGQVVLAADGVGTSSDACEALTNGALISGNIALVDRGSCTFVLKVKNAQNAGAIGVIVADNGTGLIGMGGSDPTITIPSVMVSQADGNAIRAQLGSGVTATLRLDPSQLAGASPEGQALMYAPNPVQGGSSVSHWDVSATPNLLMEPAINSDLTDNVDLTRYLFEDIGWLPRTTDTTTPGPAVRLAMRGAPNPFRDVLAFRVDLPVSGLVDFTVFDITGRSVRTLASSWWPAGVHAMTWDGDDADGRRLPAGVYLARIRTAAGTVTRRMVRVE